MTYLECGVAGFLLTLKNTLPEFKYLQQELWSPSTDYDERLLSYVVNNDVSQQLESKDWIGLVWSMGNLNKSSNLSKIGIASSKNQSTYTGDKYDFAYKTYPINIGVFTDEPHEAVKFMEAFTVILDRTFSFYIQYPAPYDDGYFEQEILEIENSEFTKLDRDTRGSLTKFGFSFSITIPIARFKYTAKLYDWGMGQITTDEAEVNDPNHFKLLLKVGLEDTELDNLQPCFEII